jgi:hypothetical protein
MKNFYNYFIHIFWMLVEKELWKTIDHGLERID